MGRRSLFALGSLPLLGVFVALVVAISDSSLATRALPLIIAHRAGAADAPENTLEAIGWALTNGSEMIWLSVQLSSDGVPVLYRPLDLSALTPSSGPVASKTWDELRGINAGHTFSVTHNGTDAHPFRDRPTPIPSLEEAINAIPRSVQIALDMKALPAAPQAESVARVLDQTNSWSRTLLYSTETEYQEQFSRFPLARMFESRSATFNRLITLALTHSCDGSSSPLGWVGFEYDRTVTVRERFTLGENALAVQARLWTPEAVTCFRSQGSTVHIAVFGINTVDSYCAAARLGVDAVLADSPRALAEARRRGELACS